MNEHTVLGKLTLGAVERKALGIKVLKGWKTVQEKARIVTATAR